MNTNTKIYIGIGFALAIGTTSYFVFFRKKDNIMNYDDAKKSGLIGDILWKVIAREGSSKNYKDIIPLDGGTVGIAHFAVGGLGNLYEQMDTKKYFGKTKEDMIKNYSNSCRPTGRSGNDSGWGCFSMPWWRKGMDDFLRSSNSKKVQDSAWGAKMEPVVKNATSHGWNSKRQIAIALGVANSKGAGGFNSLAGKNGWDAEKTLKAYNTSAHYQRRVDAINKNFPLKG
jgi:hypothetical protein